MEKPPNASPKFPQRIACLWFPHWPIQRLVVARPELRRQYLVLFQQDPRRGRLISAASPLANQAGVRVGMPLSEAKSLLQRATRSTETSGQLSPQTSVPPSDRFFSFEHDIAADRLALHELADALAQFSPIVGVEQLESPSGQNGPSSILLEITGLQQLFGSEEQLAAELLLFVQGLEYVPRLAIANTLGVAWGASRFGTPRDRCRTPAPDDCLIIPADDCETFLSLPIESLRLESQALDLLHQLGIETNEQLWRLPRAELAMRFGNTIHRRIDQATGKLAEPIIARQMPTEFSATQLLEYPTHHRETIEVIIGRLLEQVGQQLHARQQGGLQWLIMLRLVDQPAIRLNLNLFQASATASEIMPLVQMQLEQHLHSQQSGKSSSRCRVQVQEIQVVVAAAVLLVPQQRLLFDEGPQLNRQALTQLINCLTSRLGQPQVVYPQLLSGAQPEYSYRFRPLVDIHRRRRTSGRFAAQSHVVGRPLRIFQPALELVLEIKSPKNPRDRWSGGGEEERLIHSLCKSKDGSTFTLTQATGPERIETGWWRGPTVCRDYWRVETETGQSLWIYRDLRLKRWFLQGEF